MLEAYYRRVALKNKLTGRTATKKTGLRNVRSGCGALRFVCVNMQI
jgi:hypothetical protein